MSANPVANGGLLRKPLDMPDFRTLAVEVKKPGTTQAGNARFLGILMREIMRLNKRQLPALRAGRVAVQQARRRLRGHPEGWLGEYFPEDADGGHLAPDGRVMEMLSEHTLEGWLEGYILSGRHGLINSYESFVHVIDSMVNQHAKWLEKCNELPWRAKVSSLNLLITAPGLAAGPQRVHPPGPRLPRRGGQQEPQRGAHLPAARRQLPALGRRPLLPQPQLRQRHRRGQAAAPCSTWTWRRRSPTAPRAWASGTGPATTRAPSPTWCMASCGDVPTLESLAAAALLRQHIPDIKIRFVNVVDLFKLVPRAEHPHGLSDREFEAVFTPDKPVVFNFHGYPWLIHRLTYRRPSQHNLHVRGYKEQGNINTPLELAIRNQTDRFSLAMDAIDRIPRLRDTAAGVREELPTSRLRASSTRTSTASTGPTSPTGNGHSNLDSARLRSGSQAQRLL